ncbi:hypothetical protein [Streptomyces sannanensis]
MPYIGVLFLIGSIALICAAAGLALRNPAPAWLFGALVSGGMIVGFTLSRTVGLPNYHEQGWEPPYGVLCLIAEAGFIAAFVAWRRVQETPAPIIPLRVKVPTGK